METLDLLAHQGGWDELAVVGGPVAVFGFLLWLASRRTVALTEDDTTETPGHDEE